MPERTYEGFAARGEVAFPDGSAVRFTRAVPVDVTDDQAKVLDENPDWGGTPAHDDLEALDKAELQQVAAAEGVEVSARFGADRLRTEIREHRLAATAEVDSADPEEA